MNDIHIFQDLDECLIHAEQGWTGEGITQVSFKDDETYGVKLRPGAKYLLARLRLIDPALKICTTATKKYAEMMNSIFDLDFAKIYSREDIKRNTKIAERGKCFLLDDKSYWDLGGKFNLLGQVGKVKLIGIPEYWGRADQSLSNGVVDYIVSQIS